MEINVKHVTKHIKKSLILNDVTISLRSGNIYGLQGPNGSGKTMLMRLVSGLIRPSMGEVWIDGKQLGKEMDFPSSVGLLIENPGFLPNYTGVKNLELLAKIQNRITITDICQVICDVGLNPVDKRKYGKYSLGMKQRLGIAAAIMEQPELLLLDEPTNALDDEGIKKICSLICRERDRGALVIMTCHDANILEQVSDEVFALHEGRVEKKVSS